MRRLGALASTLLVSICIAVGFQSMSRTNHRAEQSRLVDTICEFVQHQAQIGATRSVFDAAHSLLRLNAAADSASVVLHEGLSEYGTRLTQPEHVELFKRHCVLSGLADARLEFAFREPSLWTARLAGIFLLSFALINLFVLSLSVGISALSARIAAAISDEVSSSLQLDSPTAKPKVKPPATLKFLASILSSKVLENKPKVDELKKSISESNAKVLSEATQKIHALGEAEKGRQFAKAVRQVKHDIRGPLSALKVFSGRVSMGSEEAQCFGAIISRIEQIISDLDNKEGIASQPEDLAVEVAEVAISEILAEKNGELSESGHIRFSFSYEAEALSPILVHRTHFRRAIANIVQNSVEALNGTGKIAVTAKREGEELLIEISDNGCGMPTDIQNKIFDEFFTFGKSRGSGLGLAHAKSCLTRWRGSIKVESIEGRGTTVFMTLPLVKTKTHWIGPAAVFPDRHLIAVDDQVELSGIFLKGAFPQLTQLFRPREFLDWFTDNADPDVQAYSIDFHLDESFNGVDIIRQLPENFRKTLTTDDYLNSAAVEACAELGVPIVPKPLLVLEHLLSQSMKTARPPSRKLTAPDQISV